jgi:molybdopterin-guanine dinucleotide biosynthesis protein A
MILPRSQVALGILAGGQARRMGGIDKALARHRGERLIDRVLAGAGEGFAQVLVSYNGSGFVGGEAVRDLRDGHPGPLAGIEALLAACQAPWLLSLPVDIEDVPPQLCERLAECAADSTGVRARHADGDEPLVALWPVAVARVAVGAALDSGQGAVHRVQHGLGFAACAFDGNFGNLNTPADLRA